MNKSYLLLALMLGFLSGSTQVLSLADSTLYDFWVGEWDATWTNSDGTKSTGKNSIRKILDNRVIQENFSDMQGFKGTSISVYNSQRKTWHQAWADNQGIYYNFLGEVEGDKRIFRTSTKQIGDKQITQRMVFYDITSNSMTWDWELSNDGGKTWQLQWRIFYKKK